MTTRLAIEVLLIAGSRGLMGAAGMDTVGSGSNSDLNWPIAQALLDSGYTLIDITAVSDVDVGAVSATDLPKILEFSHIYLLQAIVGNLVGVDTRVGERSEALGQLAERALALKDELIAHAKATYGFNVQPLTAGVYDLSTAEVQNADS